MVNKTLLGLSLIGALLVNPVFAKEPLTETQLENCIFYDEKIDEKRGNINRLEDALDEMDGIIDSYDYKLGRIDSALSHTIGYKRDNLIYKFNSINDKRNNYVDLYNKALDKKKLRIKQHNKYLAKYNSLCKNATLRKSTHDKVCGNKNTDYCNLFDFNK